ncbi:MAG: lysophospholipid acyltransferase family protein [Puniceicoccales bacterium]
MDAPAESATPKKSVRELFGWRLLIVRLLAAIARAWCASLRIQPDDEARRLLADPRGTVFVLWHNRLFGIAEVHRRFRRPYVGRPIHGLISASKDGAWLAAFFDRVGIRAVRGSSSWRGVQAAREALKVLDHGDLGITPDGPRGPCYDFKPGAALLARKANCPVALLSLNFNRAWRLKSWDGFYLPWPGSRVELIGRVAELNAGQTNAEATASLSKQLKKMTRDHQADLAAVANHGKVSERTD